MNTSPRSRPSAVAAFRASLLSGAFLLAAIAPLALARPAAAAEWSSQERANFVNSCTSSAASDERVSTEQARRFCQCVLDGFTSSAVSDADRQAFVNNRYDSDRWPSNIRQILGSCRRTHVPGR